jgi:predicted porin
VSGDLVVGVEAERGEIGSVEFAGAGRPREGRTRIGFDASYSVTKDLSAFGAYTYSRVRNRNFISGADGSDHVLRLELTHSF